MVGEMLADRVRIPRMRMCMEIIEETLVRGSWDDLEVKRD
jgi:hypothetical protein